MINQPQYYHRRDNSRPITADFNSLVSYLYLLFIYIDFIGESSIIGSTFNGDSLLNVFKT